MTAAELRADILERVTSYYGAAFQQRTFLPGETPVPCAGRAFDSDELVHLVDSALDFWLTAGRYATRFEHEFARFLGVRHAMLCNSGSSANLLSVAALTSPKLGERQLRAGDEVITVAAAFPTTVFPLVQCGLVPVFVDADLETYNANPDRLEEAITPRTRAIMLAHTLGNPFDLDRVMALEHQVDDAERLLAEAALRHAADFRDLHIYTALGDKLEAAADALKRIDPDAARKAGVK